MKKFSLGTIGGDLQVWHVERLWKLSAELPVETVPLRKIVCLDDTIWFGPVYGVEPTCRRVAAHARRIYEADFDKPVILSATGRVMDGMHRVAKAWILGLKTIRAVKFPRDPKPDETRPMPPNEGLPRKVMKDQRGAAARSAPPRSHNRPNGATKLSRPVPASGGAVPVFGAKGKRRRPATSRN